MANYEINTETLPIDFECKDEPLRRVLQNVKNLLMTRRGEIPFDRQRGLDQRLFDLPIEEARAILLPEIDRALLWEPAAEAVSADITQKSDGETVISCVVKIGNIYR